MAVTLFSFVEMYGRALDVAAHILTKGTEYAATRDLPEEAILDWRLIEDMNPLRFQLMVVCDFPRDWLSRAAGLERPAEIASDLTVAQFHSAIAETRAWVSSLTPEQFADRDDEPLTVSIGGGALEPTLPVGQWITGFATTNIYFHLSTAYAILRSKGVPIGKLDLFPTGL